MKRFVKSLVFFFALIPFFLFAQTPNSGFTNAGNYGFSPNATGMENVHALQKAVDVGGTIIVSQSGTYNLAGTVYIGSNTTLEFGNGVFIKKVIENGPYSHVFLNKGAGTKQYNEHISIIGLNIIVNGVDVRMFKEAYGLHGQLAFFYVKDLNIRQFRCLDVGTQQYAIQVCTFEDLIIDDVIIKGLKDGVHLGRGKRFSIRNGVFQTYDDAIALNAADYSTGNPELGWIENGVVENCHDLIADKAVGFFCRIIAGAWLDWTPGMKVQQSDAVVSNGRIYRVQANPDGKIYTSNTQPIHESGKMELDGIKWGVVQTDTIHTCGVRNVIFRNIFLEKPRVSFSIHFDNDKFSRNYYPGAQIPMQEQITLENIRVLHNKMIPLLNIATPVDVVTISNSSIRNNSIVFTDKKAMTNHLKTIINIYGCVFNQKQPMELLKNNIDGKEIFLKTFGNVELYKGFEAKIIPNKGNITVDSDLTGLRK